MKKFGTLEYVLDRYSQNWSWKVKGDRAVTMVSKLIPQSWYGDGPHEAIIPDNHQNVQQIKWIVDRYPMEVLSKSAWKRKASDTKIAKPKENKIEKLQRVYPKKQFRGKLLNFQKEGLDFLLKSSGNALLADEMGLGKAQPLYSKILTPVGWKLMKDIQIGDKIINSKGKISRVTGVYPQGKKEIFEVIFSDGSKTRCCEEHLWQVNTPLRKSRDCHPKVVRLKEIVNNLTHKNGNRQHFIPLVEPIQFPEKDLPIDPYLLGLLLGDGGIAHHVIFSTADQKMLIEIDNKVSDSLELRQIGKYDYSFVMKLKQQERPLKKNLKRLGLFGCKSATKFIPEIYKINSVTNRIKLLQGLMDTDGYVDTTGIVCQYTSTSKKLIEDIIFLIQSLGGTTKLHQKQPKNGNLAYTITISLPPEIPPFKLKRKRDRFIPKSKYKPHRSIKEIKSLGIDYAQCISTDADDHLYVTDDFIVTHNTVMTLAYLATENQAFPTLVIAPLVTLSNWQREIEKFLKKKSRNGKLVEKKSPTSFVIRKGKSSDLDNYDFYIINYELLDKRFQDLSKLNIKTIICDEVQNLRSKSTKKYSAVKKLAALPSVKYRIGLSGTPIYNRGSEIWPIVDILRPGLLGNFKEFCEYFCYVNEKGKAIVLENKRDSLREELHKHVMLRRKKSDVLKELKDKVRYKEIIDADSNYYYGELKKIWNKLEEEQKVAETEFDKSASYQRAIQSERQAAGVAKLPHVINFVKNIMDIEESVVVFCHHKSIHKLLHESLKEYFPSSIIGGQTDKTRNEEIRRFQDGETKLMIAGLRAGNVGINLTNARYVVFAELDWSPAIHRQAEDRSHRIGQKNTVFAYYLVGKGTLDDHVANVLVDKSYEIDSVLDETSERYENKEKAKLILAQIHDKLTTKTQQS